MWNDSTCRRNNNLKLQLKAVHKQAAFTMLEILIVMVVIGILATLAIPRLTQKAPTAEWTTILDEFNNLVYYARQEAISNQKVYRLHFKSSRTGKDSVVVEREDPPAGGIIPHPEKSNQKLYTPVKSFYFNPSYILPNSITIQAVYHGKTEQFSEQNNHAYCYIIPDGLVQEVSIHLQKTDESASKENQPQKTFRMSPFFGNFEMFDGHIQPPK